MRRSVVNSYNFLVCAHALLPRHNPYLYGVYTKYIYFFSSICVSSLLDSNPTQPNTNPSPTIANRHAEGSGGLTAGFHTILLCVIASGFNINSFTMMPHTTKVQNRTEAE